MAIVVQRSFIIERGSFTEFERLSREGIWPYMEARGCKILGLFTNSHGGSSDEVILLTAYASHAHWESTRLNLAPPAGGGEEVRALQKQAAASGQERARLTVRSSSRVLQQATDWVDYGVEER